MEEEFNNFMQKVNDISRIVSNLASKDGELQKIGDLEARKYLQENQELETIDVENIKLKVKSNRTSINQDALKVEDNPTTMSQEAFMKEVERDAKSRYKDRMRRRERMETLKKQGNLAFRRGEYEKAVCCYNNAIDNVKDCALLYLNRALALINLELYDEAIADTKMALRLNENSLKAWLLLAKIHYLVGDLPYFNHCIQEAKDRNKEQSDFVNEYASTVKGGI